MRLVQGRSGLLRERGRSNVLCMDHAENLRMHICHLRNRLMHTLDYFAA